MRKLPPPQDKLLPIVAGHRAPLLLRLLKDIKKRHLATLEAHSEALGAFISKRWEGLRAPCIPNLLHMVAREAMNLSALYTLAKLDTTSVPRGLDQYLLNRGFLLSGFGPADRREYRAKATAADAECRQLLVMLQQARAAQSKALFELESELKSSVKTIYANTCYLAADPDAVTPTERGLATLAEEATLLAGGGTWTSECALEFVAMTSTPWLHHSRLANGTSDFEQLIHACLVLLLESSCHFEVEAIHAELRNRERLIEAVFVSKPDSRYLSLVLEELAEGCTELSEAELLSLQNALPAKNSL